MKLPFSSLFSRPTKLATNERTTPDDNGKGFISNLLAANQETVHALNGVYAPVRFNLDDVKEVQKNSHY
jgi:hypothetical protein